MPITRKPKPSSTPPSANPAQIRALVARGGSAARPVGSHLNSDGPAIPVVVRIPEGNYHEIDMLRGRRPVKTPRHRWLLEAIHEKLMRERKQYAEG